MIYENDSNCRRNTIRDVRYLRRGFRKKIKWINQASVMESLFPKQFWYLLNPFLTVPVQTSISLHWPIAAATSPSHGFHCFSSCAVTFPLHWILLGWDFIQVMDVAHAVAVCFEKHLQINPASVQCAGKESAISVRDMVTVVIVPWDLLGAENFPEIHGISTKCRCYCCSTPEHSVNSLAGAFPQVSSEKLICTFCPDLVRWWLL